MTARENQISEAGPRKVARYQFQGPGLFPGGPALPRPAKGCGHAATVTGLLQHWRGRVDVGVQLAPCPSRC
jgi:hypothetical protein